MISAHDARIERLALQGLDADTIARRLGQGIEQVLSRARMLQIPLARKTGHPLNAV